MFRAFVGMPPRPGCRSGGSGLAFNGRMASGSQADNRLNTASKVLCRWQFRPSRRYLRPAWLPSMAAIYIRFKITVRRRILSGRISPLSVSTSRAVWPMRRKMLNASVESERFGGCCFRNFSLVLFCGILIPHLLEALREKRREDLTQTGMGGTFHFVDLHLRLWIADLISVMRKCIVKIV